MILHTIQYCHTHRWYFAQSEEYILHFVNTVSVCVCVCVCVYLPVAEMCQFQLWAILIPMATCYHTVVLEVYKCGKHMSETMAYYESTIDAIKYFILPLCLWSVFLHKSSHLIKVNSFSGMHYKMKTQ